MAVADDVPSIYDCVINGYGYTFLRTLDGSYLSSNRHRAEYTYTNTFVERQNVGATYGDDQQQFFLTASQKDWSLGQGEFFYRGNDPDKSRMYNTGKGIDSTSQPGKISVRPDTTTLVVGSSLKAGCPAGHTISGTSHCYVSHDPTDDLHTVDNTGTDTNNGAHGAGVPNQWGMCTDGVNVYIAGSGALRKWTGAAFSTFSATANAGSLAYLNNALYSCDGSTLKTYDTAGTATTLFTWKDAGGTALAALTIAPKIAPFGGQLLIYFPLLIEGPELWLYDGVGCKRVAVLPESMIGYDIQVLNGVVFMSGQIYTSLTPSGVTLGAVPIVYYWANGTIGEAWRSPTPIASVLPSLSSSIYMPSLGNFSGKLIINNPAETRIYEVDPATGAATTLKNWTQSGSTTSGLTPYISSGPVSFLAVTDLGNTGGNVRLSIYPHPSGTLQSGEVTSALIDFESTLTKTFRGIKVDWEQGGSVDIYYGVDNQQANTLLQASAVSGTEYTLPAGTTGHSICYRVKLNNSGGYPVVKRVYVRAAPTLQSFRTRTYNLDLSSTNEHATELQDGVSFQPLTGHEQAANLITAIQSTTPVTITDRFGTYTAVLEPGQCSILELHSEGGDRPSTSGSFVASIVAREV